MPRRFRSGLLKGGAGDGVQETVERTIIAVRSAPVETVSPQVGDEFSKRVIVWQKAHGRHDLPWQGVGDAYRVWLSEIMLQQTQVRTVIPYFLRFIERFPDLETLAAAPLEGVLEAWAGLGYYARARNLHRCAQLLLVHREGKFPADPLDSAALPGIGRSTAAAISIFAFGRRAAILDGNVRRVLVRCFAREGTGTSRGPGTRELWALAEALLPVDDVAAYTQGMMDLGATICTRRRPRCGVCPLSDQCVAAREGRQEELPTPALKRSRPLRTSRLLLLTDGRAVLLERRQPSGVWGGLLSLPEAVAGESEDSFVARQGCRLLESRTLAPIKHDLSHFRLCLEVVLCAVERLGSSVRETGGEWVDLAEIDGAALPAPLGRLLASLFPDCRSTASPG
ncbi:A/G-specific adenine glycosylase [Accumulibacter sp.]|uniref:A/G-specific adenine glycosylase n=1 Tax=Accumulibacter sp. TaxID=2053492 RepID=UPI0025DB96AA|nr:A/G-specific adenine glycosylase [Accumulibacter sp.]MCM8596349.1 A/G-specific adenine glycosylase [Accumulibacter sp.]MCM8627483.1 A/G-specific adenine glycosylase [Accumulibacter sp.]MDS4050498.1 A/G-specific adenine glycosylase [Accumulibacter sp.]